MNHVTFKDEASMLQVVQYQKTGEMLVALLTPPAVEPGYIIVRNTYSAVSAGTERTSVSTAQASMLGKARSRPDLVRQVVANARREGLLATYKKVQNRLDNYKELGYSSAGIVVDSGTEEFKVGDRVACAGYGHHSELILVPKNLAAKIPDGVDFDEASMTTIGTIALQGVRQADVRLGETVAVIGLGLIGLVTVQLLKANGCRVVGLDVNEANFELAKNFGCDLCLVSNGDSLRAVQAFTNGIGTDAAIITAGTKSNTPVELSLEYARKKSRVVIVGSVGMDLPRSPLYEKELDIRISTSYGPGRYDPVYEEKGNDYPIGYVRWTEKRNMEAVLDLLSQRKLDFKSLVTHKIPISEGTKAYDIITGKTRKRYLGVLIEYPESGGNKEPRSLPSIRNQASRNTRSKAVIGFIGAGNFAQSYLIPFLRKSNVQLKRVATRTPVNAMAVARKFGFEYHTTSADEILRDNDLNTVFIATRHKNHGELVAAALKHRKNVFVEKPLAISKQGLTCVLAAHKESSIAGNAPLLMVGFNRRFSEAFKSLNNFFDGRVEPMTIHYRVNAGSIPKSHWLADETEGGRIIGEACHFIDVMQFLTGAEPLSVYAEPIKPSDGLGVNKSVSVVIRFSDGSLGTLQYVANGASSVPKEYCEVYCQGKTAILDDFKHLLLHQDNKTKRLRLDKKKGHKEEVDVFLKCIESGGKPPISFESIYLTTMATLKIEESMVKRCPVSLL